MQISKGLKSFLAFTLGFALLSLVFANCSEFKATNILALEGDLNTDPTPDPDPLPPQPNPVRKAVLYLAVPDANVIETYAINLQDGKLKKTGSVNIQGEVVPLGIHPNKKMLYAGLRTKKSVASYSINPQDGSLTFLKEVSLGLNPIYVFIDFFAKNILFPSTSENAVAVLPIAPDGSLSDSVTDTEPTGSRSHSVIGSADGKFIYVPGLSGNFVSQFILDATAGTLTPNPAGASTLSPPGVGPRHVVHHPKKDIIYVVNEVGDSVSSYQIDKVSGVLTLGQTISTLPANYEGTDNNCADIHITADGKFLYASNRGHNSLAIFSIDSQGALVSIGYQEVVGTPREFEIDPTGKFIYVGGLYSNKLSTFTIAPNGLLNSVEVLDTSGSPMWLYSLALP